MTQLIHKILSREVVPESDASEDSSIDSCSDHEEGVASAQSDDEGGVTLSVIVTDGGEVQDLEYGGEWDLKLRYASLLISKSL